MKFTLLITTAVIAVGGVSAGGDQCDLYKWHPHNGYGGPKQCAPGGYYQSYDYPECSDQNSLSQKCDDYCNKDSSCGGYVAYLNKYMSSYRGKCLYYKDRPSNPQSCNSGYPTQIYCRYRSPVLQCFYKSKDAASKYCSSYVQTTKTETKTVTPTCTETTTVTPTCTEYHTTTKTKCKDDNYHHNRGDNNPRGDENLVLAARAPIPAPPMITNEARNAAPPPACLQGHDYKPEKITSACSCIGVTSVCTTVYATTTGWPTTTYVTKTAPEVTIWKTTTVTVTKTCGQYQHY